MINSLVFKNLNDIELYNLTKNTIILLNNKEALEDIKNEFKHLKNDINYELVLFSTNNNDMNIDIYENTICRDLSGIYEINRGEQTIIMSVEPMATLSMQDYEDLWLVKKINKNIWNCIPFISYDNYKSYKTKIDVYRFICESNYACNTNL